MLSFLKSLFIPAKPAFKTEFDCPRCNTLLAGELPNPLYCEQCHTSFEIEKEVFEDYPTGINYTLSSKSYYGEPASLSKML